MRSLGLRRWIEGQWPRIRHLLPRGHHPYPVRSGRLYLDLRESQPMFARLLRTYEPEKYGLIWRLFRPGDCFVDVGANKGDFTIVAARCVGPQGRVVAIEPNPVNAGWLRRSIDRNALANVTVHEVAVGDRLGEATLYLARASGQHSIVGGLPDRDQGQVEVRLRTLDSLLESSPQVRGLKVDVEGAEAQVLAGAARTLARPELVVVMVDVHPTLGVDPTSIAETLRGHRYETRDPAQPERPVAVSETSDQLLALRPTSLD